MSDAAPHDDRQPPFARRVRGRWPGLVWAIPLAALIICAYLGVRALSRHGVEAVVTFDYAEGVTPGDTKVLENGVEIGHVKRVRISQDGKHVDVTLSLDPRAKKSLNTNTMFWLIGENPTITDIQSIRAAVAGVIIALAPGTGGTPTRRFQGLGSPPVIAPGAKGTIYWLDASKLGSVQPGAGVTYRGLTIGKIVRTGMIGYQRFAMQAFVNAPYDSYIKQGGQFWSGSPLKLSLSGASLSAGVSSPSSLLQGAVEYELPERFAKGFQAPANTRFALYDDQSGAQQGPTGPEIPYRLVFSGPAGDLGGGSEVKMLGYTVGRLREATLLFAPGGRPYTQAVIGLYPRKLDVVLPETASMAEWRRASDRAVSALLRRGFRAKLAQSPPFVGAHVVMLADDRAGPTGLGAGGALPTIPVSEGGAGTDDLVAHANSILGKVDRMPLAQIGDNVRRLTGNLASLTGSPQVRDATVHLDGTLRQLDQIMTQVKPQVGPLVTKLNQTADELHATAAAARTVLSGEGAAQDRSLPDAIQQLDGAARSIRSLTDYLGRHPEALIRGKAKEKK
ncbi:intermembrane transport protein PqiB [Sphingomonas sp.]|uniref:PqiB family protein n=1 Tax=Sphingomonas sp. TaxID=28214 RepID=UPI003B000953